MKHDMSQCLSAALLAAWLLLCPVGHMIAGSQQTLRVQSGGLSPGAGLLFGVLQNLGLLCMLLGSKGSVPHMQCTEESA